MATGLAIMGFGGGAMIGTPLADLLMKYFATPQSVGVWQTFVVFGVIYFAAMMAGAFGYRLPAPGWKPAGWTPPPDTHVSADAGSVPVNSAWTTRQFWLLWGVLCMNVTAGIGILGIASPMVQEIFKGRVTASAAAGFIGLLSLFNIGGRIFWASLSDRIGRKATYTVFFALGMLLYASAPTAGASGSLALFVAIYCVILTMYGGGFATIPAYLADTFGVGNVSAIHGRLLTAWSTAGILGPVLVNYIREFQISHGVAASNAYTFTVYILVAFLGLGLICNLAVRPVARSLFTLAPASSARTRAAGATVDDHPGEWGFVAIGWLLAGIPIGWGVYKTLTLAGQMFR
jgi:MFS family permease